MGAAMFLRWLHKQNISTPQSIAQVDPSERLYAIGDIHGRLDLLKALLEQIEADAASFCDARRARVIFLGDYVDRGDQSCQVLELLSQLHTEHPELCEFLMGNHERAMLDFLENPIHAAQWLDWGGRQTLTSYGVALPGREPGRKMLLETRDALYARAKSHLPFLNALHLYTVSGDVICAHAALDPKLPLQDQPQEALLWGQVPSGEPSGMAGKRLIHGHFDGFEPVVEPHRICVDTGAYYSGRLTALRLDASEGFLVTNAADLMP
jgi:serine/threonine protein phosphatase 1